MSYRIVTELNEDESALVDRMADVAGIDHTERADWISRRFVEELFDYAEQYLADATLARRNEEANLEARELVAGITALRDQRFPRESNGRAK